MSKKKPGKKAVKKLPAKKAPAKKKAAVKKAATKKAATKKAAAKKAAPVRRLLAAAPAPADKKSSAATIFLYQIDGAYRVRTSPQLLGASPGYIEWTVVNLASDEEVDVEISWPGGGPWGADPIRFKGNDRKSLADAKPGRYKYNVTIKGFTEDPEVEFPVN